MKYVKKIFLIIGCVLVAKLVLAYLLQLSNDEVYYITYARELKANYFDHPPVVGILIKIFSLHLQWRNEIFLRLGFIICGAVSSGLVYLIAKKIYSAFAGWMALLLFMASVYANVIGGMMMMPDAPMLLCWLWAVYLAVGIVMNKENGRNTSNDKRLLLFGIAAGLAIMSKISAGMLWVALGLYALLQDRRLLQQPYFYIALLLTTSIAAPVLYDVLIVKSDGADYHTNRIAINPNTPFQIHSFLSQLAGEVSYNNPVNYFLSFAGLFFCWRKKIIPRRIVYLLLCFATPLIAAVWGVSLFRDTLPHWTGPAYVVLLIFGAIFLAASRQYYSTRIIPGIIFLANGLTIAALFLIVSAVYFLPFSFNNTNQQEIGKGDLLLDFSGWKQFSEDFATLYKSDVHSGRMKPNATIITDYWFPAAHIDWYVSSPHLYPFLAIGRLQDIHEYAWLNKSRGALQVGADAYYISVSNYPRTADSTLLSYFTTIDTAQAVAQIRSGRIVRNFFVTRLKTYKGGIPDSGVLK